MQKACIVKDYLPLNQKICLYSYWFDEWATIIHLVKRISENPPVIMCRMHGYDFDEAQVEKGYHLFRSFDLRGFDKIFSVSTYGKSYISKKYNFQDIMVERLGVKDKGENPFISGGTKTIVSCSALIPLKRVHLIASLLGEMKSKIVWVHFGGGPLEPELLEKTKRLPGNIEFSFRGQVENSEIMQFYKVQSVDAFINVSELEGIPVALMEAISFGIPVIGCDICGVPEIVNFRTGLLISKDFDIVKTAGEIDNFLSGKCADPEFRKGVKSFWADQYNADKIYPEFINRYLLN